MKLGGAWGRGLLSLCLAWAGSSASAEVLPFPKTPVDPGQGRPGVVAAPDPAKDPREESRIEIVNRYGGEIRISRDRGRTWRSLHRVLRPVHQETKNSGFVAADWAYAKSVAATAVNAIHLKLGQGEGHAELVSLLPRDFVSRVGRGTYVGPKSALVVDTPGGEGLFQEDAPRRGAEIRLRPHAFAAARPWPKGRPVQIGDRILIVSSRPEPSPGVLWLENHFGGRVSVATPKGPKVVARVYRPVRGTGRFGGSRLQDVSRVRAQHPGVLCISTSPRGKVGGFQIVPSFHSNHPGLDYVETKSVYLVVGPLGETSPALEGQPPLFGSWFRPGDRVEALGPKGWQPLPPIEGHQPEALVPFRAFRIVPGEDLYSEG